MCDTQKPLGVYKTCATLTQVISPPPLTDTPSRHRRLHAKATRLHGNIQESSVLS